MITVEPTRYSPAASSACLDNRVADEMRGARGRRLDVNARMLQPLDPCLHQVAVIVEQRGLVERALWSGTAGTQ